MTDPPRDWPNRNIIRTVGKPFTKADLPPRRRQLSSRALLKIAPRTPETLLEHGLPKNYRTYIDSPEWKHLRRKRLEMDHHTCDCGEVACQVHHTVYRRDAFCTRIEDLRSKCRLCHQTIHLKPYDD